MEDLSNRGIIQLCRDLAEAGAKLDAQRLDVAAHRKELDAFWAQIDAKREAQCQK